MPRTRAAERDCVGRTSLHLVERDGGQRIARTKVILVDNDEELTTLDFVL